jgi:hypothetical protein
MVHVDDLIEPRTKQILLAALPPLPWPHRIPPFDPTKRRESQLQIRGNPQRDFARKSAPQLQFPANPNCWISGNFYCRSNASGYFTDDLSL